jgi:hypothetical protein
VLKLGPLELTAGVVQGQVFPEILLTAEEEWLMAKMGNNDFEYVKEALEGEEKS